MAVAIAMHLMWRALVQPKCQPPGARAGRSNGVPALVLALSATHEDQSAWLSVVI